MEPEANKSKFDQLFEEFESGALSRRDLAKGLIGLVSLPTLLSVAGLAQAEEDKSAAVVNGAYFEWKHALFERIINQAIEIDGDGNIVLKDPAKTKRPFVTYEEHVHWVFGSDGVYKNKGLEQLQDNLTAVQGNTYPGGHQGKPVSLSAHQNGLQSGISGVDQARMFADNPPKKYLEFPNDLYGLFKAKLDFTSKHCCIHTLQHIAGIWGGREITADSLQALVAKLGHPTPDTVFWKELARALYHDTDVTEAELAAIGIELRDAAGEPLVEISSAQDSPLAFMSTHTGY